MGKLGFALILLAMSFDSIKAGDGNGFPPAPFPPDPTMPPMPVAILQQNIACGILSSALSSCTALTSSFTELPPTQQASCLCYSSSQFVPQNFDNAARTCAEFAFTAAPDAYGPLANLQSFCGNIGSLPPSSGSTATANPTSTATGTSHSVPELFECANVNSILSSCALNTPNFFNMEPKEQANCLCYNKIKIFDPTKFDDAVHTCAEAAKKGNADIYFGINGLEGFCAGIGDIMASSSTSPSNSSSLSTTSPPITSSSSPPVDAGPTTQSDGGGNGDSTGTVRSVSKTSSFIMVQTPRPSSETGSGHAGITIVNDGEVIGISFVCALVLLFLC